MKELKWRKYNCILYAILFVGCAGCTIRATDLDILMNNGQFEEYDYEETTENCVELAVTGNYTLLNDDQHLTSEIKKNSTLQFKQLVPNSRSEKAVLYITPCWPTTALINVSVTRISGDGGKPEPQKTYEINSAFLFISEQEEGMYDADVTSINEDVTIDLFFLRTQYVDIVMSLIRYSISTSISLRMIKFKKIIAKNQTEGVLEMKWPQNQIDESLQYAVIISTTKFYQSVCEFDKTPDNPDNKTIQSDTTYKYPYAIRNQTYYISIFLTNYIDFSVPYARGNITFVKSKPVNLKDGRSADGNIKSNNGRLSFRYKVSANETNEQLYWFVIPCGGVIKVEIRHKKKVIISKPRVSSFVMLKVPGIINGERYVMKIWDESYGEIGDFTRVEVLATTRLHQSPLPIPPPSWRLEPHIISNSRSSITIAWHPATSVTGKSLTYHVFVKQIKDSSRISESGKKIFNQCNTVDLTKICKPSDKPQSLRRSECVTVKPPIIVPSNNTQLLSANLPPLKPKYAYSIRVYMYSRDRRSRTKRIVPYEELIIPPD